MFTCRQRRAKLSRRISQFITDTVVRVRTKAFTLFLSPHQSSAKMDCYAKRGQPVESCSWKRLPFRICVSADDVLTMCCSLSLMQPESTVTLPPSLPHPRTRRHLIRVIKKCHHYKDKSEAGKCGQEHDTCIYAGAELSISLSTSIMPTSGNPVVAILPA